MVFFSKFYINNLQPIQWSYANIFSSFRNTWKNRVEGSALFFAVAWICSLIYQIMLPNQSNTVFVERVFGESVMKSQCQSLVPMVTVELYCDWDPKHVFLLLLVDYLDMATQKEGPLLLINCFPTPNLCEPKWELRWLTLMYSYDVLVLQHTNFLELFYHFYFT